MDIKTTLCGIELKNPVMPASGPLSGDDEKLLFLDSQKVGAVVTKTISVKAAVVPRPCIINEKDTVFNVGQYSFEIYYPGQGHTADNIVIWFDKEKILYGGCLIKGADAENLGYLGDANVFEYHSTLKNVQQKYPNPKFIIVSHSEWDNINSLKHSIKLAKKLKRKNLR